MTDNSFWLLKKILNHTLNNYSNYYNPVNKGNVPYKGSCSSKYFPFGLKMGRALYHYATQTLVLPYLDY